MNHLVVQERVVRRPAAWRLELRRGAVERYHRRVVGVPAGIAQRHERAVVGVADRARSGHLGRERRAVARHHAALGREVDGASVEGDGTIGGLFTRACGCTSGQRRIAQLGRVIQPERSCIAGVVRVGEDVRHRLPRAVHRSLVEWRVAHRARLLRLRRKRAGRVAGGQHARAQSPRFRDRMSALRLLAGVHAGPLLEQTIARSFELPAEPAIARARQAARLLLWRSSQ